MTLGGVVHSVVAAIPTGRTPMNCLRIEATLTFGDAMRRISIKSMMWYVSFTAVALAALRNANYVWISL